MPDPAYTPPVLAGPILRRMRPEQLTIWLATRAPAKVRLELYPESGEPQSIGLVPGTSELQLLSAGTNLHYLLVNVSLDKQLPLDEWVSYRLSLLMEDDEETGWQDHSVWAPDLTYEGQKLPGFMIKSRVGTLLHGSCRKPHHDGGDGLVAADAHLQGLMEAGRGPKAREQWPAVLVMSGDQVYADDVAGPMLKAIHQLINRLGVHGEKLGELESRIPPTAEDLFAHHDTYYKRENFLPNLEKNRALWMVLFGGVEKPIFTADHAHNHLITLSEFLCMYLLIWSPAVWQGLSLEAPENLSAEHAALYEKERKVIEGFVEGLGQVRRLFAHLPVAMIFDDHDVTDDWNLNRDWEETAYSHPFSRRIIGNALAAYMLNQGWGNRPEVFEPKYMEALHQTLAAPGTPAHDAFLDDLYDFEKWDYLWPTDPPLIVLDTRTRRWRSESAGYKPSGLLDWEAVTDLQRELRGRDSVMLVSAAPIFGVKLIETLQKLMTYLGKPLMVDAEYWMAHPGTADGILNVFRHRKTPDRFTILSGDVHYSFVYDVELRGRSGGPDIWQICSSGIKNEFPASLLSKLDHLNRWLYSPRSPLNWLTRRRGMKVIPRKPEGMPHGRRLLNASGIGLVEFDENGGPKRISQLLTTGEQVFFSRRENEARWD
ncbi:alkaline phosphatase family protein [Pseudovibrio exalbescens]|uniref:alkaline phosphatase family protein n=1 Tax=Pseudovibrio exalbescens TaxID=197461 RepID=UPI002365AE75|nr:alkaline phosphatase family protein [Pseudovibrio exalbescens]MDD7908830.1 alkaline phosphatase family protein [Pseudovibrio exalbescens]